MFKVPDTLVEKEFEAMAAKIEELGFKVTYNEDDLWEEALIKATDRYVDMCEMKIEEAKMEKVK